MERLWSPWRLEYVTGFSDRPEGCFMCTAVAARDDAAHHVLHRGDAALVLLNAYPYNTGHLMVAPTRHVGDLVELTEEERVEVMELTTRAVSVIRAAMQPHGFNIGINLGHVAGAGLPGHVHVHVVPRWGGDTNFMPIVGETKVLPEMLADTYAKLKQAFAN